MTREQAWELITQYNKEPFHLKHAVTVEGVMKYFAEALGHAEEKELWGLVGLLHDLDFEMYPEQHCRKQQEMMKEAGIDEVIIRATASHGWPHNVDIEPVSEMEKVLYAIDELTGLCEFKFRLLNATYLSDYHRSMVGGRRCYLAW
jgi:predicted hydrolase (HD superfamily)